MITDSKGCKTGCLFAKTAMDLATGRKPPIGGGAMKHQVIIILKAVALATGIATIVLGLMQRIAVGEAIMLLALGQSCLALTSLQFAGSNRNERD